VSRLRAEKQIREMLHNLKSQPCIDCNVQYPPYVMDYDHRDPSTKLTNVAALVRYGSYSRILAEIDKCDLVCANCHRIRTHMAR
jgi:hypothetical protein